MPANGTLAISKSPSGLLDNLLKDLSKLERCTENVLTLVRSVLKEPTVVPVVRETTRRRKPNTVSSKGTNGVTDPLASADSLTRSRSAQKIVKACLTTLGQACANNGKSVLPRQTQQLPGTSKLVQGPSALAPSHTQTQHASPNNPRNIDVATECCSFALCSWSTICIASQKDILPVVKTRYNLVCRLLELQMLPESLDQLCILRRSIHVAFKLVEKASPLPDPPDLASELDLLLYEHPGDISAEDKLLVLNAQGSAMKYINLLERETTENFLAVFTDPRGPLAWCLDLSKTTTAVAAVYFTNMSRYLTKFASRAPASTQLVYHILSVKVLLAAPCPDYQSALELFCRGIPAPCDVSNFESADRLARIFLDKHEKNHASPGKDIILILIERMTRLALLADCVAGQDFWSQCGVANSPRSSNLAFRLDGVSIAISRFDGENSEKLPTLKQCTTGMPELSKIESQDVLLLLKSMNGLRMSVINHSRKYSADAKTVSSYLEELLAITAALASVELPSATKEPLCSTASKVIETWMTITHVKRMSQESEQRIEHFKICLSITTMLNLSVVRSSIGVLMYNSGGLLYSRGEYEAAAQLLDLCFSTGAVEDTDAKKLDYLWSAYALSGQHEKSYYWMSKTLERLLHKLNCSSCVVPARAKELYPELFRVTLKITQTLAENLITEQIPTLESVGPILQGFAIELHLLHLRKHIPTRRICDLACDGVKRLTCLYDTSHHPFERFRALNDAISIFLLFEAEDLADEHAKLLEDYTYWYKNQAWPETGLIYEAQYIAYALPRSQINHGEIDSVLTDLSVLCKNTSMNSFDAGHVFRTLMQLQQILYNLDFSLDFLKLTDLMIYFHATYKSCDTGELLSLEITAAEECLCCGFDGQANLYLKKAQKTASTLHPRNFVLSARLVSLEIRLLTAREPELDFSTQLTSFSSILESCDTSSKHPCHTVALICLARYAEFCGSLGEAIRFRLEALSLMRRSLHRHGRSSKASKSPERSIVQGLSSLNLQSPHQNRDNSIEALVECLQELAHLHEKIGVLRDAVYYWEEAKVAAIESKMPRLLNSVTVNAMRLTVLLSQGELTDVQREQLTEIESQNPIRQIELCCLKAEMNTSENIEDRVAHLEAASQISLDSARVEFATHCQSTRVPDISRTTITKKASARLAPIRTSTSGLERCRRRVLCALIGVYHKLGRSSDTAKCLAELEKNHHGHLDVDDLAYVMGTSMLLQAEDTLGTDPVYGALQDSALSLPSICTRSELAKATAKKQRKGRARANSSDTANNRVTTLLKQAKHDLATSVEWCRTHGQSYSAYRHSNLFAALNLIHSALLDPSKETPVRASPSNFLLESSRCLTLLREQERSKTGVRGVPDILWSESLWKSFIVSSIPEQTHFQVEYIDVIPERWNVVSIGLSSNERDLVVSRMQRGKSPLILRLPMSRHNARDVDEDTFAFQDAKAELKEIISQSDDAAQRAKNIKDKQDKTEWWKLRQHLDARLKTLLDNIEHCWLGGFRGVLGLTPHDTDGLEQFRQAFAKNILKNVPLDQNRSFDLDTRVLDLFIDLGPIDGESSLELLEDLLYFVLDIYQFHGESIAYDEIDIDQMVVEVQTALNNFHERAAPSHGDEHTILILDKHLHGFPWESLPCLRSRSVSRVPSLSLLRVLLQRRNSAERIQIERSNGRFVLNPGQDLKSTEESFARILQALPGWAGIIGRKPEETEILSYLEGAPIYMYFGHGGGEQYVRANKIKKLSQCAVSVLMGCSSGALKDQGIFDPWGTPYNYMVAACSCLVANLWDVTDKDIDRFSHKMLHRWSLLSGTEKPDSLCAAVARSRDECVLQYLNGAAPVVYGLPVWLVAK